MKECENGGNERFYKNSTVSKWLKDDQKPNALSRSQVKIGVLKIKMNYVYLSLLIYEPPISARTYN